MKMMNSQVIGPRTMMNLNQGKYNNKIGHMQDTGMVNPKNRHSRMRANAANTAKGGSGRSPAVRTLSSTQPSFQPPGQGANAPEPGNLALHAAK